MTYSTPLEGKIDQTIDKVPGFVGQITTGISSARNVHVKGSYAYVTSNGDQSVKVIDISDPATPVEIGDHLLSPAENPTGIFIAGHYAYVVTESGNHSLFILDISDPTNPVKTSDLNVGIDNLKKVIVSGKYAYITGENATTGGLVIVDISDPVNPFVSGTLSSTENKVANAFGIDVIGKYAYIACSNDQLTIVDVSDPTNPVVAGAGAANFSGGTGDGSAAVELNEARGIEVRGKYAFIACKTASRLTVCDVSDPEVAPVFVTSTPTIAGASDVSVVGKYAYVAAEDSNGNFARVDISLPLPSGTGNLPLSGTFSGTIIGARGLYVEGNYAYIAALDNTDSFTVVDIKGAFLPSLETGSLKTDLLTVTSHSEFTAGVAMGSGLNVSRGIVAQEGVTTDSIILSGPFQSSIIASGSATEATDYTLPTAYPGASGYSLTATTTGVMSWTDISGGGSGDVVGPGSATDNAIARYDTTTGKLVQDSLVLISDTGAITGATTLGITDTITITGNSKNIDHVGTGVLSITSSGDGVTVEGVTHNAGALGVSSLSLGDSSPINLGAGNDLVVTHTGAAGSITNVTGSLTLESTADTGGNIILKMGSANTSTLIDIVNSSNQSLFRASGGYAMFGIGLATKVQVWDSSSIVIGTGEDFTIQHSDPDTTFDNKQASGKTIFKLGDAAGATSVSFQDSTSAEVASLNSNGVFTPKSLNFPSGVATSIASNMTSGHLTIGSGAKTSDNIDIVVGTSSSAIQMYAPGDGSKFFFKLSNGAANLAAGNAGSINIGDSSNSFYTTTGNITLGAQQTTGIITLGNSSQTGTVDVETILLTKKDIQLQDQGVGTNKISVKAGDGSTAVTAHTLILPPAIGSNDTFLKVVNNSTGELGWGTAGGATVSGPNNSIQFTTDSSTLSGDASFTISGSNLTIADAHYLVLGNSSDFQIAHFDPNTLFYNNNATGDTVFRLGDTAGATEFRIRDSGNTDFFHVDSSATMKLTGKITKKSEFTDGTKLNNISHLITRGAYSYMTTLNNDSFIIMDIRRPDAMTISSIVGELVDATNLDQIGRFAIKGNHAFILKNGGVDEIAVVDITDPSNPTYVDSFSTSGMNGLNDIKIKGNVAYICTSSNERFYSIDISDPSNLVFLDYVDSVDNANLIDPEACVIVGDYAYVVCHGTGGQALVTVDISDPKVMSVTSSLVHNGSSIFFEEMRDIVSNGQYLFAITFNSPSYVSAIDISTASAPTYVSRITPTGLRWGASLVISGKYLYTLSDDSSSGEIFKIDITNPASMSLIEDINETNLASPNTIAVQGNYLHVGTALDYYMTFYIGGTELSSAELGSTTSSNLSVTGDSYVGQDSYVDGTLHVKNGITSSTPFYFPSYVVASLPSASPQGGMIFVSNASGGAVMAFSDGTDWRRVTDRAIIS